MRPEASLSVVIVSDEDDQSLLPDSVLTSFFRSLKGARRSDRVAVHAFAGPTSEVCADGPRGAIPGYRYERMAQRTGGLFFNICQEDWSPALAALGEAAFQPIDAWPLTQAADASTLVVEANGGPIPTTYDPSTNTIHLTATPTTAAVITASYDPICAP